MLANQRLADMFGYEPTELIGHPVEAQMPARLRAAHRSHRAAYLQAPQARPMGAGARLVGLRKDGATFPVEISLSPVPAATGYLTLAVIRDGAETRRHEDLADIAEAAAAASRHTAAQNCSTRSSLTVRSQLDSAASRCAGSSRASWRPRWAHGSSVSRPGWSHGWTPTS